MLIYAEPLSKKLFLKEADQINRKAEFVKLSVNKFPNCPLAANDD